MVGQSGKITAEAGQRQIEHLYQSTAREFARHKHVAQNRYPLAGEHSFNGMKLLAEAQRMQLAVGPWPSTARVASSQVCQVGGDGSQGCQCK